MVNIIICYSLIVLYNFLKIKYELRKSSFKVIKILWVKINIIIQKKKVLYVDLNIYKNNFKWNCKVVYALPERSSSIE